VADERTTAIIRQAMAFFSTTGAAFPDKPLSYALTFFVVIVSWGDEVCGHVVT
jgi:hypothetical protein